MFRLSPSVVVVLAFSVAAQAGDDEKNEFRKLRNAVQKLQKTIAVLEHKIEALEPLRREYERQQRDLAEAREFGGLPGPIESTGKRVSAKSKLKIGQILQVQSSGTWYAARILKLKRDGKVKIHYLGWSSQFDEIVPRTRLQFDPQAVKKAKKTVQPVPTLTQFSPGPVESSGIAITAATPLKPGQEILVESGEAWWAAKVLSTNKNGTVKIHYVGWSEIWDETIPRSRIQLRKPKRR